MKKTFYYFLLFLGASSLSAQTIVGTTVEQKKPLLEKFTGVNCGACPGGDNVIQTLKTQYGDDLNVFAHHTFTLSPGFIDYKIPYSEAIAYQSIATGYPAGSINRVEYTDWQQNPNGTAMSPLNWGDAIALEVTKDAYVNIGSKLRYDIEFNKFYIDVELYYTDDPEPDQRLNVALVQDHINGPQAGGGLGDNYEHNHMLRELLTGQWGEALPTAANGELITKSYELDIPNNYGPVDVIAENMEVVVFVTEGQTVVANSTHAEPEVFLNYSLNPSLKDNGILVCGTEVETIVEVTNYGNSDLTDLEITYSVNGVEYIYNWTGNLEPLEVENITLPATTFSNLPSNTFTAEITNTNNQGDDDAIYNNTTELTFGKSNLLNANSHLVLQLDGFGSDITWKLFDDDGITHYSGGPYANEVIDVINTSFNLSEDKCYTFEIKDSEGNGLEGGQNSSGTYYPAGYYKFTSGSFVVQETAFGSRNDQFFTIDLQTVGATEIELNKIKIFPNPSSHTFEMDLGMALGDITYTLTDVLGKTVVVHTVGGHGGKNGIIVDHGLPPGVYHLNVVYEGGSSYAKLIVQ